MPAFPRLSRQFFEQPTLVVARQLLGTRLVRLDSAAEGGRLAGIIVEVEAYRGEDDLGCHARAGRTLRTQVMYGPPGHTYVYFTYGMHWLLNFVTEAEGFPAVVLIRALWPTEGIPVLAARRSGIPRQHWTDGPAKLCRAFHIQQAFYQLDMCVPEASLFVEEGLAIPELSVTTGPRVGLNSVPEPWKSIPWRFRIQDAASLLQEIWRKSWIY